MKTYSLDLEFAEGKPPSAHIRVKTITNDKYISCKCSSFSDIEAEILRLETELTAIKKEARKRFPY